MSDSSSENEEDARGEDEDYRESIERNRVEVVQSLDLDRQFMLSYLRSNNVLDDEDCQLILNSGTSRQQKNSKFLDVIAMRGAHAYQSFINALEFEHGELYEKFTGRKPNVKGSKSTLILLLVDFFLITRLYLLTCKVPTRQEARKSRKIDEIIILSGCF